LLLVILSHENDDSDDPTRDYINANYVDGYKQKNAYISTQGEIDDDSSHFYFFYTNSFAATCTGPLPKTAGDFWQMVWDQQCLVIVMTTKTMERGRVKCHQYWESTVDESCEYGPFTVKTTHIDSNEDYTVSTLVIKNSKVRKSSGFILKCHEERNRFFERIKSKEREKSCEIRSFT
jgi:tyrosine-protein phosphatase non-receptor type 9